MIVINGMCTYKFCNVSCIDSLHSEFECGQTNQERTNIYYVLLLIKLTTLSIQIVKYTPFYNPRFGYIKCIRTLCCVNEGEELTCNYGYNHKIPTTDGQTMCQNGISVEIYQYISIHRVIN